jgi:succinate-semialdehyde dehydrogenase/glutarate-semialdehyde dehydrogenase
MRYQNITPATGKLIQVFEEIGGNDAIIVLEDADLDRAINWAVWGRMHDDGKTSVAAKRFIVVEELADRFLERFRDDLAALKARDPLDDATTLAPMFTDAALVQLLKQVDGAVAHGAKLAMGGKRIDGAESFMEPTILTDISPDNPAFREEFLGPVALFFRVKDEEATIALANNSDFGLGGSVFSTGIARGQQVASRIEIGMMFVNNLDRADADLPFGGVKASGCGQELGDMGIQQFVNKKLVRISTLEAPALAAAAVPSEQALETVGE